MAELSVRVAGALEERRTTTDHVADALRQAIVTGELPDGTELNQVELARHFNISRVPLREALRRLEAEGLISAAAHRRAMVIGLDVRRVAEVFDLRKLLEGELLAHAAAHIDEAALDGLRRLCDEMDATDDHERWLERNARFHQQLYVPAARPTTLELAEGLRHRVERYLRGSGGLDRAQEAGREHRRIVDALAAGDSSRARAELEAHVGRTAERAIGRLQDLEAQARQRRTVA